MGLYGDTCSYSSLINYKTKRYRRMVNVGDRPLMRLYKTQHTWIDIARTV